MSVDQPVNNVDPPVSVTHALGASHPLVPRLNSDVADLPANCVVGKAVIKLGIYVAALLNAFESDEDAGLETSTRDDIINAAVEQCHVWYYG